MLKLLLLKVFLELCITRCPCGYKPLYSLWVCSFRHFRLGAEHLNPVVKCPLRKYSHWKSVTFIARWSISNVLAFTLAALTEHWMVWITRYSLVWGWFWKDTPPPSQNHWILNTVRKIVHHVPLIPTGFDISLRWRDETPSPRCHPYVWKCHPSVCSRSDVASKWLKREWPCYSSPSLPHTDLIDFLKCLWESQSF